MQCIVLAYRPMKLNAHQRLGRSEPVWFGPRLELCRSSNDLKTAQHLRARLAFVLRHPDGLQKPLHAELKELLAISGVWVRNVGHRHQTKRQSYRLFGASSHGLKSNGGGGFDPRTDRWAR